MASKNTTQQLSIGKLRYTNKLELLTNPRNVGIINDNSLQQWDPELARVAQKWADQCTDVDYKNDHKRKDPVLFHDPHSNRKTRE